MTKSKSGSSDWVLIAPSPHAGLCIRANCGLELALLSGVALVVADVAPVITEAVLILAAGIAVKSVLLAETQLADGHVVGAVIVEDADIVPALKIDVVADEVTPALVVLDAGAGDLTSEGSALSVVAVLIDLALPVLNALLPLALLGASLADKTLLAEVGIDVAPVTNVDLRSALLSEPADFAFGAGLIATVAV